MVTARSQKLLRYSLLSLFVVYIACSSIVLAQGNARISLSSESDSIYLGDVIVLDIESTGLLEPLDISTLNTLPTFLRETTGTRIAVVGGKVVEINIRRMEFIPTQTGVLVLGPLRGESPAGSVSSNSVAVEVLAAPSSAWQPDSADLQSSMTFSNTEPVVGEQVQLEITLRHTHAIANETIELPDFNNFDVLPIMTERRTIENDQWRKITWRYLLHPKRSGELIIGDLTWQGTMIKSRTQRADFNHELKQTALSVSPGPSERPDWWLPASQVKLSDSWSKDVKTLSAGDEIIRTITLTAHHVLSSQLPDIDPYPTRALTSTLIRTTRDHEQQNDHTVATAVFEYRMIAQSPIPVFLDTVRVPWWDIKTGQLKDAILPARRINVGLPDRADLLADLAVNQSGWSRLKLNLRSYARWQSLLSGMLALLASIFLLIALRALFRKVRIWHRKRRTLAQLEALRKAGAWQTLYQQLANTHQSNELQIDTNSREYRHLFSTLQDRLFSNHDRVSTDAHWHTVASVLQQKIRLPFLKIEAANTSTRTISTRTTSKGKAPSRQHFKRIAPL